MRKVDNCLLLLAVYLIFLSGCQQDKSIVIQPSSTITRIQAEQMLNEWTMTSQQYLKSGSSHLTISEQEWCLASYSVGRSEVSSSIAVPIQGSTLVRFTRNSIYSAIRFYRLRADTLYLNHTHGLIQPSDFTGYLVVYNETLKPLYAYKVTNGVVDATPYDVALTVRRYLKDGDQVVDPDNDEGNDSSIRMSLSLPEVVIKGYRTVTTSIEPDEIGGYGSSPFAVGDPLGSGWAYYNGNLIPSGGSSGSGVLYKRAAELIPDNELQPLTPYDRANRQLAWMQTHGGREVADAILKVADVSGLSESDKVNIYEAIDVAYKDLQAQYMMAVFRPVAETLKPVIDLMFLDNVGRALVAGISDALKLFDDSAIKFYLSSKDDGNIRSLSKYEDRYYLFNREHSFNRDHIIPNTGGQFTSFENTGLTADGIETAIIKSIQETDIPLLPSIIIKTILYKGYNIVYKIGKRVDGTIVISDYFIK